MGTYTASEMLYEKKKKNSSSTEAFSITKWNCTFIGSCSAIKSVAALSKPMGMQPVKMGFAAASQISSKEAKEACGS